MLTVWRAALASLVLSLGVVPRTWADQLPTSASSQPAVVPDCLGLIADTTVPDGTEVSPGQTLEKHWSVINCGSTTWSGYRATRVDGDYGPASFAVPSTAPGEVADLSVTVTAPTTTGCPAQRATYRVDGPHGPFGDLFWIELVVADAQARRSELTARDLVAATLLDPAELGANWYMSWFEGDAGQACAEGAGYSAFYLNSRDYPTSGPEARVVGYVVQVAQNAEDADDRILQANDLPGVRIRTADGLGDGAAALATADPSDLDPVGLAEYRFRVGPVVTAVSVLQPNVAAQDLTQQARQFALLGEKHLRQLAFRTPGSRSTDSTAAPAQVPGMAPTSVPTRGDGHRDVRLHVL